MRVLQVLCLTLGITMACSGVTFYSGADSGTESGFTLGTNSLAARNLFVSGTFGLTTIDFSALALGNTTNLGAGVTASCVSCDFSAFNTETLSGVVSMASNGTNNEIGYNTTGATTSTSNAGQFYRADSTGAGPGTGLTLTFTFTSPTASGIGFYVTGIETFIANTTVTYLEDGLPTVNTFTPNPLTNTNGSNTINQPAGIQFVGIRDEGHVINSITITTSNTLSTFREAFSVDDIVFGNAEPEPSVIVLTATGLLGMVVLVRKRRHTRS